MIQRKTRSLLMALLVTLMCCPAISAQQSKISVASFNRMETDITARVTAPKRDQNGEVCALIRIVTNVKDLMFEPDALGITARENKTGEIWLYVPRGARRISILHDELGIMRNYFYPEIIDKATVYEMVLNTGDGNDKPAVENNMQFFVLRPEPANANVYVDDEQVPIENGLFSATMPKGDHTYRVEAPMYQSDAGVVTLGSEQVIKSVTLKPKFGYMEIFSLPEQDAKVTINGEEVGVTPYRSDRMAINQYNVRIEKHNYFPIDTVLTVTAGETVRPTFNMKSTIKQKVPVSTIIMVNMGYNPNGTSYGATLAFGKKKNFFYLSGRSDFGSASGELECDEKGILAGSGDSNPPFYSEGVKSQSRMSGTVGYMRLFNKWLGFYIGAGYGKRTLTYELAAPVTLDGVEYAAGTQVKDTDNSVTGAAAEIGALLTFGKFCLSVGGHTVGFKYHELSAGIGIKF
jgi:hypothetical protein